MGTGVSPLSTPADLAHQVNAAVEVEEFAVARGFDSGAKVAARACAVKEKSACVQSNSVSSKLLKAFFFL